MVTKLALTVHLSGNENICSSRIRQKKLANFEVDLTLFPNISGCLEVLLWELSNGYDACLCTKFVLLQLSDR